MGTMSAAQIYDNFHQAPGTGMWQSAQDATNQLAQGMPELAADIKRLQDRMQAAWKGSAADEATQGAQPLALEYMNTADGLRTAQDLLGRQAGSFVSAANSVQPVPPVPSSVDVMDAVLGAPNMQQKVTGYLDASQHNVDVYTTYHGASQYNTTNLPMDYGHIAADNATVIVTGAPVTTSGAGGWAPPTSRTVAAQRTRSAIASTGRSAAARSGPGHVGSIPVQTAGGSTPTSHPGGAAAVGVPARSRPSDVTLPSTTASGSVPATRGATSDYPRTVPVGMAPPTTGESALSPVAASGLTGGPWRSGNDSAGGNSPAGGVQPVETPESGSTPIFSEPRRSSGGLLAAGGRSAGVGRTGTVDRAGSQARASSSPQVEDSEMAPMGTGRGRRRDDEEHRVPSFLQQPDDDLFGVAERAVLPVIGE